MTGPASGWRDTTAADWVGAYVDLNAVARDRTGYAELMLDFAQIEDLPRSWLQSACQWQQWESKLRPSNAFDAQLAAYLPDCDVFITGDKRYHRVLSGLAELHLIPSCRLSWSE